MLTSMSATGTARYPVGAAQPPRRIARPASPHAVHPKLDTCATPPTGLTQRLAPRDQVPASAAPSDAKPASIQAAAIFLFPTPAQNCGYEPNTSTQRGSDQQFLRIPGDQRLDRPAVRPTDQPPDSAEAKIDTSS